jgi:8-oxo-dGTP diphosphatase
MALKRLGAAAVILDEAGHVLMVRHTYGRLNWEIPGGHAEPYESILDTVVREVREETGLHVRVLHTTGTYYEPANDMHHFVFRCEALDLGQEPRPSSSEIGACAFWPPDSLPRPISDFTIQRIREALERPPQPLPHAIERRRWLQ